jgi:hypothetical protein
METRIMQTTFPLEPTISLPVERLPHVDPDQLVSAIHVLCVAATEVVKEFVGTGTCIKVIAESLQRIADVNAPKPSDLVDTEYIRERRGYKNKIYVTEMARKGKIPAYCVAPGSGNGNAWRFFRDKIDQWLQGK